MKGGDYEMDIFSILIYHLSFSVAQRSASFII